MKLNPRKVGSEMECTEKTSKDLQFRDLVSRCAAVLHLDANGMSPRHPTYRQELDGIRCVVERELGKDNVTQMKGDTTDG